VISGSLENDLANALHHELCSFAPALFESNDMLLEVDKPNIANAISSAVPSITYPDLNDSLKYVLDGGTLVQCIPWQVGTHDKILQLRQLCDKALWSNSRHL